MTDTLLVRMPRKWVEDRAKEPDFLGRRTPSLILACREALEAERRCVNQFCDVRGSHWHEGDTILTPAHQFPTSSPTQSDFEDCVIRSIAGVSRSGFPGPAPEPTEAERCRQEVVVTVRGRCELPDTHTGDCSLDMGLTERGEAGSREAPDTESEAGSSVAPSAFSPLRAERISGERQQRIDEDFLLALDTSDPDMVRNAEIAALRADERRVVLGRVVERLEDEIQRERSHEGLVFLGGLLAIVRAEMEGKDA